MSARFSDTRRVRLTLERPVASEDLIAYGRVVRNEGHEVALDVPRAETARATAALLQALPVADVAIEETDVEDVLRDVRGGKGRRGKREGVRGLKNRCGRGMPSCPRGGIATQEKDDDADLPRVYPDIRLGRPLPKSLPNLYSRGWATAR